MTAAAAAHWQRHGAGQHLNTSATVFVRCERVGNSRKQRGGSRDDGVTRRDRTVGPFSLERTGGKVGGPPFAVRDLVGMCRPYVSTTDVTQPCHSRVVVLLNQYDADVISVTGVGPGTTELHCERASCMLRAMGSHLDRGAVSTPFRRRRPCRACSQTGVNRWYSLYHDD